MRYYVLHVLSFVFTGLAFVGVILSLTLLPSIWLAIGSIAVFAVGGPALGLWSENAITIYDARRRYVQGGELSPREEKAKLKSERKRLRNSIVLADNIHDEDQYYLELVGVEAELKGFKKTRKVTT